MLLKGRTCFKPFTYPDFYDRWQKHERSHWLPTEVQMSEDINDWNNKLQQKEKDFLINIFRFFTQGDIDVAGAYCTEYLPYFCKTPEICMLLCSIVAREAVHIDGYSYLIETLGMPESTYREFLEYKEMSDKQRFIKKFQKGNFHLLNDKMTPSLFFAACLILSLLIHPALFIIILSLSPIIWCNSYKYMQRKVKEQIAGGLALFSGFTEGMQLFSSFTMLLSFPKNGLMKGMGQIVTWSIVDETQHTEGMIQLLKIFIKEYGTSSCKCNKILGCDCIRFDKLKKTIKTLAKTMVDLEDEFINLAYKSYAEDEQFMGISKSSLKLYIRYIADKRLIAMDVEPIFNISSNPLPEFEVMINAPINTNFFENRSTDYAKTGLLNWTSVWK
nr:MAG: hypothetical protein DiTV3a_F1ORF3 [Diabrotica toursvirus 3a]